MKGIIIKPLTLQGQENYFKSKIITKMVKVEIGNLRKTTSDFCYFHPPLLFSECLK